MANIDSNFIVHILKVLNPSVVFNGLSSLETLILGIMCVLFLIVGLEITYRLSKSTPLIKSQTT